MVYVPPFFFYNTRIRGHYILRSEICTVSWLCGFRAATCKGAVPHLAHCCFIYSSAYWPQKAMPNQSAALQQVTAPCTHSRERPRPAPVRAQPLPYKEAFKWTCLKTDKICWYLFFSSFGYALVHSEWKLLLTILSKTQKQLSHTMVE